jgi:predicted small lipoprotein YifL
MRITEHTPFCVLFPSSDHASTNVTLCTRAIHSIIRREKAMHAYAIKPFLFIAMLLTIAGCAASGPAVPEEQTQPVSDTTLAEPDTQAATDAVTNTAELTQSSVLVALEDRLQEIYERVSPS